MSFKSQQNLAFYITIRSSSSSSSSSSISSSSESSSSISSSSESSSSISSSSESSSSISSSSESSSSSSESSSSISSSSESSSSISSSSESSSSSSKSSSSSESATEQIILLMHMDDVGLTDSSNYSHSVTLNGAVRSGTSKFGSYSCHVAANTWLDVAHHSVLAFGDKDFTIDCWMRLVDYPGDSHFISKSITANSYRWGKLQTQGAGRPTFAVATAGAGAWTHVGGSYYIGAASWRHFAFERYGNNLYFYWNGTKDNSPVAFSGTIYDNGDPLRIGFDGDGSNNIDMYIDELRILNYAAYQGVDFTPPSSPYANP